jgi:HEAT repeat protein
LLQGPWTESDLEKHWTDLAALDATEAYRALQALHSAEQKAVELLSKRLRPAPMVDSERIPRFVKDLDHDEFTVRERASRVLEKFGDRIAAQLQQALANQPSPELRRRVEALLEQGNLAHNPEKLRALRAVEVLERIGSVNAQQVLGTLSQGASDDRLTKEAKAALRRLAK